MKPFTLWINPPYCHRRKINDAGYGIEIYFKPCREDDLISRLDATVACTDVNGNMVCYFRCNAFQSSSRHYFIK